MSALSDQTLMDDENKDQIEQIQLKKVVNQQPVTETTIKVNISGETTVKKKKERFGSPPQEDDDDEEDYVINRRKTPVNIMSGEVKGGKKKSKIPTKQNKE